LKHVIIGNGPAGVVAAETLRKLDPHCAITLLAMSRSRHTRGWHCRI
jgi:protoporphyrinogen oxidase